jgi:excisionase family DNA binding protein
VGSVEILTAKEVAHRLSMNVRTVVRHMAAGKIPGFQICVGGDWRCRESELEEYLRLKHEERGWRDQSQLRPPMRIIRVIVPPERD